MTLALLLFLILYKTPRFDAWCLFSECLRCTARRQSAVRISNAFPSFPFPGTIAICVGPPWSHPAAVGYVCAFPFFLSVLEVHVGISWGSGISPLVRQFIMRHSLFPSQAVNSKHFHLEFCPRILTILPILSLCSFMLSAFPFEPSACQLLL